MKAQYAVKIGQKRAKRTVYFHAQKKKKAFEDGQQGRNQLTNWFQPKAIPAVVDLTLLFDSDGESSLVLVHPTPKTPSLSPDKITSDPAPSKHSSLALAPLQSTAPVPELPHIDMPLLPATDNALDMEVSTIIDLEATDHATGRPNKPYVPAPSLDAAKLALHDIKQILRPRRKSGADYKDPGFDLLLQG